MRYIKAILNLKSNQKKACASLIDAICVFLSYSLSYEIRIETFTPSPFVLSDWLKLIISLLLITMVVFYLCGVYKIVVRQFIHISARNIAISVIISSLVLILLSHLYNVSMPRSIPIIYGLLLYGSLVFTRYTFKHLVYMSNILHVNDENRILIYGAGNAGRELLAAIRTNLLYIPVGFLDDNERLWNTIIQGVRVYNPNHLQAIIQKYRIKKVLLALPSLSRLGRKQIIDKLETCGVGVFSVPSFEELASGHANLSDLRKVPLDDLLGRDSIPPVQKLLDRNTQGQTVLVTGAGGSIGSELCRQIIKGKAKRLVLFDFSETALYLITQELRKQKTVTQLIPIIGNVQKYNEIAAALETFKVDIVYHAAAYKHVPMVEYNIVEGICNNIFGTLNCVKAVIEKHTPHFILISTDKAVRPTNIMGATKRVAEMIVQAYAREQVGTQFCLVRFGNVLGSSGSVVPLFQKQIERGGPVTVTHPDIMRYFMSIPEAVQLVIQAGAMGKDGEVFVLDMGTPVKILDLAKKMIRLSGLRLRDEQNPRGDIAIKISGLRPGEKLYEELLIEGEFLPTEHPRIFYKHGKVYPFSELEELLKNIQEACKTGNIPEITKLLGIPEISFKPESTIQDLLWKNSHIAKQHQLETINI